MSEPSISLVTLNAFAKAIKNDPALKVEITSDGWFALTVKDGELYHRTSISFEILCDAVDRSGLIELTIIEARKKLADFRPKLYKKLDDASNRDYFNSWKHT